MAKLMKIGIEVEEGSFGRIINLLNGQPGVVKIDLHINKPAEKPAKKSDDSGDGLSLRPRILALLSEAPGTAPELAERSGIETKRIYNKFYHMKLSGLVKKMASGQYALTAAGKKLIKEAKEG